MNGRSRKYQLTFNNPLEYGCTHEAIKEALKKWENLAYGCLCDEIGEQGTPHTHLFIQAKNPLYFNSIKNIPLCTHRRSNRYSRGKSGIHTKIGQMGRYRKRMYQFERNI